MQSGNATVRKRVPVSEWAAKQLAALSVAKGWPEASLYRLALELGCTDIVSHFRALDGETPAGFDRTSLSDILPGVERERKLRAARALARRKTRQGD